MGTFTDEYENKVKTIVAIDIEATVKTFEGEFKKVWICEGYNGPNDRSDTLTLYREGDEVRNGIARGCEIVQLHVEECRCAVCEGRL